MSQLVPVDLGRLKQAMKRASKTGNQAWEEKLTLANAESPNETFSERQNASFCWSETGLSMLNNLREHSPSLSPSLRPSTAASTYWEFHKQMLTSNVSARCFLPHFEVHCRWKETTLQLLPCIHHSYGESEVGGCAGLAQRCWLKAVSTAASTAASRQADITACPQCSALVALTTSLGGRGQGTQQQDLESCHQAWNLL